MVPPDPPPGAAAPGTPTNPTAPPIVPGSTDDHDRPPPQAQPPGAPPAAPPAAPAAPPAAPATPEPISMTTEQLNDRLTRDRQARLREMGFESEEALQAALKAGKDATEAEEERRREQLSNEAKLQEDLTSAQAAKTDAEAERDQAVFQYHVAQITTDLEIRNLDYAMHLVSQRLETVPDGEQLDVKEYLSELVKEGSQHRAPLGVAPPVEQVPAPAQTTPMVPGAAGQPTPPAAGGAPDSKSALDMDAKEWAAKKASLGIM